MKKITLKELKEEVIPILRDGQNFSPDTIKGFEKEIFSRIGTINSILFIDGKNQKFSNCDDCGKTSSFFSSSYASTRCNNCSKQGILFNFTTGSKNIWRSGMAPVKVVTFRKVTENYAIMDVVLLYFDATCNKNVTVADPYVEKTDLTLKIRPFIQDEYVLFFDYGLRIVTKTNKLSSCNFADKISIRTDSLFSKPPIIQEENFNKFAEELQKRICGCLFSTTEKVLSSISNFSSTFKKKTSARIRTKSYVEKITDLVSDKSVDNKILYERILDKYSKAKLGLIRIKTMDTETITYETYCPNCGFFSLGVPAEKALNVEDVSFVCPSCGEEIERYGNGNEGYIYFCYWEKLNNEHLICHNYCLTIQHLFDKKTVNFKLEERYRTVFSAKHMYMYQIESVPRDFSSLEEACKNLDSSIKERVHFDFLCADYCLNTPEELILDISKTDFKYSGLIEAWGLGKNKTLKVDEPLNAGVESYIYYWRNFPAIEQLLKVGLTALCKNLFEGRHSLKSSGSTACEILGITKPELRILQNVQAELNDLSVIHSLYKADNEITADIYKHMVNLVSKYNLSFFVSLKKDFNISYVKALEYIEKCSQFQCIPGQTAIGLWDDYLSMSKDIGYNLKNKSTKYPDSLRKEHDIVTSVFNTISKDFDQEAFKKKAEENKHFNYSLKELNMFVKVPETAQEVVSEGMDLHHCVARYVNPIIKGASIVCFIRNYSTPDESYYTVEVIKDNDGKYKITQVRGMMDEKPNESTIEGKKLMFFIKKWAKFKKLIIESI